MSSKLYPSLFIRQLSDFKEIGLSFYALFIGFIYVSGFLVLNSHLAKSGILDIEFVNARYFLAGANFIFYLTCFYLFAARSIINGSTWFRESLEDKRELLPSRIWPKVIFLHSLVKTVLFCCLSAALFGSLAVGASGTFLFYSALALVLLISFTLQITGADARFPRSSEIAESMLKTFAIYIFFSRSDTDMMIIVFTHYLGGMFYLNIVLHVTSKNKTTWDQMLFTGLYSTVFIIGAAVSFGTQFYGQVSLKLGGAKPQTVRIGLSDDALKKIPTELVTTDRQLVEGKLIHQNSSHLYFSLKESTVRIRASDVVSLILKPEPEKNIWGDWIKPQSK